MSATLKIQVYALHGFLGKASDWQQVQLYLKKYQPEQVQIDLQAFDLFSSAAAAITDFESYTQHLCQQMRSQSVSADRRLFLGYSLGGRLGLHLLQQQPELFDHFIFLSTNPGMPDAADEEPQQRLQTDQKWADQITAVNWDEFLIRWNAQGVFKGSQQEPQRDLKQYDLEKLRQALRLWSLGYQPDFRSLIRQHRQKIQWVVGRRDTKYLEMARQLQQDGYLENIVEVDGGHRLWADAADQVAALVMTVATTAPAIQPISLESKADTE